MLNKKEKALYEAILTAANKTKEQFPIFVCSDPSGRSWLEVHDSSKPERKPFVWSRLKE